MRKTLVKKRKSKGFTQKELARELGISERQYYRLEAGTSNGKTMYWFRLSEILGAKIEDLYNKS